MKCSVCIKTWVECTCKRGSIRVISPGFETVVAEREKLPGYPLERS